MTPLKISIQDGKACEKTLKIEVPADEVKREFDAFYHAVAPKAKIPGFRPGKAPRNVLALHFEQDAKQSVLKQLVAETYRQALQEKSIEPVGMPEIEVVNFKEDALTYQAKIETRPKIKLSRVAGLKVKKEKPEIKPEDIQEALKRIQESFAQFKAVEDRAVAFGDCIIADYECFVDGQSIEKRNDDWFEIREKDFLEGFSQQLVGSKAAEEKEVRVKLPENFSRKDHAGKEAVFKVKIKEIKEKKLPALDDDLAKDAGECKTLDELKEKVKTDLLASKEKQSEVQFEKALLDELIKHNKIELPRGLVARRVDQMVHDSLEHYRHQGADEAKLKEMHDKLEKDFEPEARRQIHIAFLLDEIAVRENMTVTEQDLKSKFEWIASQVKQPVEAVEQHYSQKEDALSSLQDQIRNEKAIEFIKKNAKN